MIVNLKNSSIMYYGTGRRKAAISRVRLIPGTGKTFINNLSATDYLQFNPSFLNTIQSALKLLELHKEYDLYISTKGGGLRGQADAIKLGIARALCQIKQDHKQVLKSQQHLTRDSRTKERKKYGLRKARKAPQYSKR